MLPDSVGQSMFQSNISHGNAQGARESQWSFHDLPPPSRRPNRRQWPGAVFCKSGVMALIRMSRVSGIQGSIGLGFHTCGVSASVVCPSHKTKRCGRGLGKVRQAEDICFLRMNNGRLKLALNRNFLLFRDTVPGEPPRC